MHAYDPGWLAAFGACADRLDTARTIRSTIVLPFNDRFEDWATEIAARPGPPAPPGPLDTRARADRIRGLVLGLGSMTCRWSGRGAEARSSQSCRVRHAFWRRYLADGSGAQSGSPRVHAPRLAAGLAPRDRGDGWSLAVFFTPSYVHAGSASATIRDSHGERHIAAVAFNGYEGEWRELHDVVSGAAGPRYPLTRLG